VRWSLDVTPHLPLWGQYSYPHVHWSLSGIMQVGTSGMSRTRLGRLGRLRLAPLTSKSAFWGIRASLVPLSWKSRCLLQRETAPRRGGGRQTECKRAETESDVPERIVKRAEWSERSIIERYPFRGVQTGGYKSRRRSYALELIGLWILICCRFTSDHISSWTGCASGGEDGWTLRGWTASAVSSLTRRERRWEEDATTCPILPLPYQFTSTKTWWINVNLTNLLRHVV